MIKKLIIFLFGKLSQEDKEFILLALGTIAREGGEGLSQGLKK